MPGTPRRGRTRRLTTGSGVAAMALLTAAACSSGGISSSSSASGTLKIITWDSPPAVSAIKAIDTAFHKKYPTITADLQTAANITGPYQTMLETDVDPAARTS